MTNADKARQIITNLGGDSADALDIVAALMKLDPTAKAKRTSQSFIFIFSDGSTLTPRQLMH